MQFWSLIGLTAYEDARVLQHALVEARALDLVPDTVLFLEHKPVITRGRGLQFTGVNRPRHMPFCAAELPLGLEFAESERGGDLTYHGPGQLVVYPICKLDGEGFGPKRDVSAFVRKLERLLIEEIAVCGLAAGPRENATGVWVGPRKIASIGIAVRRWVTYHGLAVNLVNDLGPFHLISPCGFGAEVMTNLAGESVGMSQTWRDDWESRLSRRIEDSARIEHLTCADVLARVERISSRASRCQVHLEGPIAPCV